LQETDKVLGPEFFFPAGDDFFLLLCKRTLYPFLLEFVKFSNNETVVGFSGLYIVMFLDI